MKRYISGLNQASGSGTDGVPDGLFLVRVERAQYRWHAQKPHYLFRFAVLEPKPLAGHPVTGRLYCTPKALWKLNWFLRDFGYDLPACWTSDAAHAQRRQLSACWCTFPCALQNSVMRDPNALSQSLAHVRRRLRSSR